MRSSGGSDWRSRVECGLDERIEGAVPLAGGCVGDVRRATLASGRSVVIKLGAGAAATLSIEARMLADLRERTSLPVPGVLIGEADLLVMDHVEHDGRLGPEGEQHAAALLAELHGISSAANGVDRGGFGYEYDTLIGGLDQPNSWTTSWREFFARHRLVEMARQASDAGRLPASDRSRVERLAARLDALIVEPEAPSLIHGDVWGGNVLAHEGRIAAFIDPAVYFAHAEIELAFIRLFGTFGSRFFDVYAEHRPIADGFFGERCDLYNLYPLLVHVRLFGGSYVDQVRRTLSRFGV